MKDLYKRLGISAASSDFHVREAVEFASDRDSARAARHILLEPRRRVVYDRNRLVLTTLAHIRVSLGLNDAPFGKDTQYSDYRLTGPKRSLLRELRRPFRHKSPQVSSSAWERGKTVAAVLCIVVLVAFAALTRRENRTAPRGPNPRSRSAIQSNDAPYSGTQRGLMTEAGFVSFLRDRQWSDSAAQRLGRLAHGYRNSVATDDAAIDMALAPELAVRPANGVSFMFDRQAAIAPFEVVTDRQHLEYDYYVKLVDPMSDETVVGLYVRGGHRATVDVPLGTYQLKYAAFRNWYGLKGFGPDATFSRADERFSFTRLGSRVEGYTVELFLQANGNLETRQIDAAKF